MSSGFATLDLLFHSNNEHKLITICEFNYRSLTFRCCLLQDIVCSQTSAEDYSQGPWQQMLKDLDIDQNDPTSPLKVFNIKWVLRRASLKGQAGLRKVPILAVLVRSLDVTHADATALLKDPTGKNSSVIK